MAKIVRSFRIDETLYEELKKGATNQNITISQLIELACYSFLGSKNNEKTNLKKDKANRDNKLAIYSRADDVVYKELKKIAESKNSTISREIYFRLKATIFNPVFSDFEMDQLGLMMINLNRLGNLLKMSLNNNLNDPGLLVEIRKQIFDIRSEFSNVILKSGSRKI